MRVHSGCVTGDIFHSLRCDCYQQLQAALKVITEVPYGAIVYVPYHEGRGIGLFKKIQAYALQDQGLDTVEANIEVGAPIDSRDYALTARVLCDLGMAEIKLLSNNPAKEQALKAHGIRVAERLPLVVVPNKFNKRYLDTKRARMAHKLWPQLRLTHLGLASGRGFRCLRHREAALGDQAREQSICLPQAPRTVRVRRCVRDRERGFDRHRRPSTSGAQ